MLHNNKPVLADNGNQYFLAEDVEEILNAYFCKDADNSRTYEDWEILEMYQISESELERMLHRLSYEYCHDDNRNYKW